MAQVAAGKSVPARRQAGMRTTLIVAAGGSSTRFKQSLPQTNDDKTKSKLFFSLQGKPLLAHTLSCFRNISGIDEVIVAFPAGAKTHMRQFLQEGIKPSVKWVEGGKTRAESVWNALRKVSPKNDWVMIHDGARPFISRKAIEKLFRSAGAADGAILAKKVVPTIKEVDLSGQIKHTVDRKNLFEAETPQLVRRSLLEKAYRDVPNALEATDEASLLEAIHARVKVLPHEEWNPKITTVQDFKLAEAFLRGLAPAEVRTGFGRDTHRLVPQRKFYLGGVRIPFKKGALGHSDGDALLHAVSDAILGAIGAGDIGEWFSDKNPKHKNVRSEKILTKVLGEAKRRGWHPAHVDTVVVLEKPRLGAYKKIIRKKMARLLKLEEQAISIKAKTAEGLGPEGEGLAVTCEAIVTMTRSHCHPGGGST